MHVPALFTSSLGLSDALRALGDRALSIGTDWRGEPAPPELATWAAAAWTRSHLWFGFTCTFTELDVDTPPNVDTATERWGLWEHDVCEAFVQSPPDATSGAYKEFEVAPTGQWCDLAIIRPRVDVDGQWTSGMSTAAAIDHEHGLWHAVMGIPFTAFGAAPADGDVWAVNLFRIGRLRGERQYLALSPTRTETPDFHRPEVFVPLRFEGPA